MPTMSNSIQSGDVEHILDDKNDVQATVGQSEADRSAAEAAAEAAAASPETEETSDAAPPTPPDGQLSTAEAMLQVLGPAFARTPHFWRRLLFSSALQGAVMGFIGLGFLLGFNSLADRTWKTEAYDLGLSYNPQNSDPETDLDVFRLGQGRWWYVGLLSAAGFVVGAIKVVWIRLVGDFPQKIPGFVDDIVTMKSDDLLLPFPMMLCSIISIGCGAVVGPEVCRICCSSVTKRYFTRHRILIFERRRLLASVHCRFLPQLGRLGCHGNGVWNTCGTTVANRVD